MEFIENSGEITLESLLERLETAGIDVSQWGQGQAKTLEHLLREIESGEAALVDGENGELLRTVVVVNAEVFYFSQDKKVYKLKEAKQIFKDGRSRVRDLSHAVSEKSSPEEDPQDAVIRGVREELGVEGEIALIPTGDEEKILPSPSFPGLPSQYVLHKFDVALNDEQYNPDGYIEEQADKTTYFTWEEIDE